MVVAATGFFDGVHLGHRKVIEQMCAIARREGKRSAIISFWPHPRNILQQDADKLRLLTTLDEKRKLCQSIGVDDFIVIPFNKAFSMLSVEEFMKEYLVDRYSVSTLIIGYDHRLGHDVSQSQQDMIDTAIRCGINPVKVEEYFFDGKIVSSTAIRKVLLTGDIACANELLGYRYALHGVVVAGNKIGRTYGFPTANLQLYEPLKLIPANGVYMVWAEVNGQVHKGICNIGNRPTMGDGRGVTIETHILDFDEDIYGLDLKIEFVRRMRDEQKFETVEHLKEQLIQDKCFACDNMPDASAIVLR
ncbi:MAG: bifunctional riboflavin kinase/FAD synthetase [Bacteroidales bacterium]|nr:bifunctional riboflavin kinase/FAD synthetase [Bacteroidales bacterium]